MMNKSKGVYVKIMALVVLVIMMAVPVCAQSATIDQELDAIYQKASHAIAEHNIEKSDYYLARYMGLAFADEDSKHGYNDLIPLFQQRKDLAGPTAFISGQYTDEFLDFYFRGPTLLWGIPGEGVNEKTFEFEVNANSDGKYFASLVISPRLETWSVIKKDIMISVAPLGSSVKQPYIVSGILKDNKPSKRFPIVKLNTDDHFLHYVWPIEFHDLDSDGIPEVWLRYNLAWADGFSQRLDIYKIVNEDKLVLLKRFEGEAEGIARRLANNRVEVGYGFSDKSGGHLYFDQHHFEIFEYKNGGFVKTSERNEPHILRSDSWHKYYDID